MRYMLKLWKKLTGVRKACFCIYLVLVLVVVIKMTMEFGHFYKTADRLTIIGLGIIIFFSYPTLSSFIFESRRIEREVKTILKGNRKKKMDLLMSIDYYTFPKFLSEIIDKFSSLFVFVFVQTIFLRIPELKDDISLETVYAYGGFMACVLLLNIGLFYLIAVFSISVQLSFSKKSHVKYVMKMSHFFKDLENLIK